MENNNTIVYDGLFIFKNAVLGFIVKRLQDSFGKGWWQAGVKRALGNVLDDLEKQFHRRYDKKVSAVNRPGTEVSEMLDVGHFLPIIQRNWKQCFSSTLIQQDSIEVWLREIIEVRNAVSHPEREPISNSDSWRALDNMVRFLKLINPECAEQIEPLMEKVGNVDEEHATWPELREGPFHYSKGFAKLGSIIEKKEGRLSDTYLDFSRHCDRLYILFREKNLTPGVQNANIVIQIDRTLKELDRLTESYCNKPFRELCTVSSPPPKPKNALTRFIELGKELNNLESEYYRMQWKKFAQKQTGEIVPKLERDLVRIKEELESKRKELEHLLKTYAPPAFFSIERKFQEDERKTYTEGQFINVCVVISNKGHEARTVRYHEGLPESFELLEGKLELQELVEPDNSVTLSYRCCPTHFGKHKLFTAQIDYQGKIDGWDNVNDSFLDVRKGTEPSLICNLCHQPEEEGIMLFVFIENRGDKTAIDVTFEEHLEISGQESHFKIYWKGNIYGGLSHAENFLLKVSDPGQICIPKDFKITYKDSVGKEKHVCVITDLKRIEYRFPVATDTNVITVGRIAEMRVLSSAVDNIRKLARGQVVNNLKRLLFIKGIEGTGKTRLVYEFMNMAKVHGIACYVVDAKAQIPVKQMLLQLLDLKVDEDQDKIIWRRLEEILPGDERSLYRETLFRFLSTIPVHLNEDELSRLEAAMLVLIKTVCLRVPTTLVFENIHWIPEGKEQKLLLALFHNILITRDEPILLCATYRPGHTGSLPIIEKLMMSRTYYELLDLGVLRKDAVRMLIDQIIDFPRFSEPLYRFAEEWSTNPFYLIELLRLLTNPDSSYLQRVGSEWYPAHGVRLEDVIPESKKIGDVIIERVERELPEESNLAKILSVIGLELDMNIVEALIAYEFPHLSCSELQRQLESLRLAGILSLSENKVYEFEHQLKREILFASLSEYDQFRLQKQIVEILLKEKIFPDPSVQVCQVARHLIKTQRDFQLEHVEVIRKAAAIEVDMCNFSIAIEYYNAAIGLMPKDSLDAAYLLIERSRLYQLRGDLLPAYRDLEDAYRLVSPESPLAISYKKEVRKIWIQIEKEQGRVLLKQPQASMDEANNLLYRARVGLEGNFRLKRFFLPNELDFHRELVEVYLALADVWLRKRNFKMCEKIYRRAKRIANSAAKKWPDKSLVHEVYKALGNLLFERAIEVKDYEKARKWYELALQYVENDRYKEERIWLKLGDTYRVLKDDASACKMYEQAIDVQKELGDNYGLTLSYGGIGELLTEAGQYEQGLYYCEQAHRYQQFISDLDRFWRICVSLVKIHINKNNLNKASEYWLQARTILFEQRRIDKLDSQERRDIYELTNKFCEYFRQKENLDSLRICLQDLDDVMLLIHLKQDALAGVQFELGEVCFKSRQWEESISHFEQALEMSDEPAARAEATERLGDIYALTELSPRVLEQNAYLQKESDDRAEPPVSLGHVSASAKVPYQVLEPDVYFQKESNDRAEQYYEEAVKLWVRLGSVKHALATYEKLINRIITDESGLLQLPFTFLRILKELPLKEKKHDLFVVKTQEVLLRNEKLVEAADIVVYTARVVVVEDETVISFDEKMEYLRRAEALYRRGSPNDLMWGLNMLIPTYFRLSLWDEIARCFEELFELSVRTEDIDEFIEAYSAIGTLEDKIDREELEYFTTLALSAQRQLYLSVEQRNRINLLVAKHYSHIADRVEAHEMKKKYEDLALEEYEKIFQGAGKASGIASVALNDSALIHQRRGEFDTALQKVNHSVQIHEVLKDQVGAARVRINRARLYKEINEYDKAFTDFEEAIGPLDRRCNEWNERLRSQDMHTLTPEEVIGMRYDKNWLASACRDFAVLLISQGDISRVQGLAEKSASLFKEIGMTEEAQLIEFTYLGIGQILVGKKVHICPSCGNFIKENESRCPSCGQEICPECGNAINSDELECKNCGTSLTFCCPHCEKEVTPDDEVCPYCGESLEKSEADND